MPLRAATNIVSKSKSSSRCKELEGARTTSTRSAMAAFEAHIRAKRAGSNSAIAAHDAEGVASCWLSDVCITHTTHGQHNGEHRIEVDLDSRVANEFG